MVGLRFQNVLAKQFSFLKPMIQTTYPVWMVNFLFVNVSETVGKIAFPVFEPEHSLENSSMVDCYSLLQ